MKVLKKTWFCAGLLLCIGLVLLAAQETVSADDVDALTLQMDGFLKERNELDEKEASVLSTIENSVSIYQSSELAKRYAELERYKDYFEAQEYQDARAEEERQVAALAQQERIRLEQNAKPELDEISRKKAELTEKIKELEKVLLNKTYKIHTVHVVEKKYDKSTKTINIRFVVPEFEENYDVIYAFDIVGMTPYEIAKKAAEEEEKDYSADVYYTVTKEDDTDFYVVTVTSLDVYSENGEKVVSDFKQDKEAKKFAEGDFFFNVANMKINDGFVFVQGGTFSMGSNNGYSEEKPVHNVTVSDFYICDHEVTQAEYKAIMETNPSYFKGDNLPVECVSWNDAVEYCNKLSEMKGLTPCYKFNDGNVTCDWNANGYRLPTEAEWEYAAKGGKNGSGYTYSGSNSIGLVAWYGYEDDLKMKGNSNEQTHAVKEKQPNELGLYDMSGNVWEWCWDWYGNYSSGAVTNPLGASSGSYRVLRGGGWYGRASYCRVALRSSNVPVRTYGYLGFRVVRSAEMQNYTVSYNTNYGYAPSMITKEEGMSLTSEELPILNSTNSGYVFKGWYTDSSFTESSKVTAGYAVYQNLTLYAKWTQIAIITGMLYVQGGTFNMGNNYSVTVSDFYMSDHEVTQTEYGTVMGTNPSWYSGDNKPVESVSWYDAIEYCNKRSLAENLTPCYSFNGYSDTSNWGTKGSSWDSVTCNWNANGYRLPTEAEWEYAARGGIYNDSYTYSGSDTIGNVAWYEDNSSSTTHDVKMKNANSLGLYDMSGNVWEWCWDWYGSYSGGAVTNPHGASSGSYRVARGGGWRDGASYCRVAVRRCLTPDNAYYNRLGFRVVRNAQ